MKRWSPLLAACLLLFLAACDDTPPPATGTLPPPTTAATAAPDATPTRSLSATTEPPLGYPAPPTETPVPAGYPVDAADREPYPAPSGFVWMSRPAGEQCAVGGLDYADVNAAVDALAAAGVSVATAATADLIVCDACGCPTSLHYRAQVAEADVSTAESLGWSVEQP